MPVDDGQRGGARRPAKEHVIEAEIAVGDRSGARLRRQIARKARAQGTGHGDVVTAQPIGVALEVGVHGRIPKAQGGRSPPRFIKPAKEIVAFEGLIPPARAMKMSRLLEGEGRIIGATAPELIALLRRRHILHHKQELVGVLVDFAEVEGGNTDPQGGRQFPVETHFFQVVLERNARLPAGRVVRGELPH